MAVVVVEAADAHVNITAAITRMLERVGDLVVEEAKRRVPVDTGELKASIHAEPVTGRTVTVRASADHAAAVELGTGPHIIEPDTKQALYWPGAAHPVKRVYHPGTPAQPYLRPAVTAAAARLR